MLTERKNKNNIMIDGDCELVFLERKNEQDCS